MSLDSVNSVIFEQTLRDACGKLEERLRQGETLVTERLLGEFPELATNADGVLELLYHEITAREEQGDRPTVDELVDRFPEHRQRIERLLEVHDALAAEERRALEGVVDTSHLNGRTWNSDLPIHSSVPGGLRCIGPYELLEQLGRGGTGIVYRARQIALDRMVALKVIHSDDADRDQFRRFQAEAEAAARLQHPNIVQIHEIGDENDVSYISMELVEGGNLADRVAQAPMDGDAAARIMITIARAISYAHSQGVVHRDLKPANILLTKLQEPKIADFGLAKRSWEQECLRTRTGAILGTPGYMAPEQAMGKNDTVGPPADVYALGAILYELLTGTPPFRAGNLLETLEQVRTVDPIPPRFIRPRLPRDLETICLKCLRKQPEARYSSAEEMARDLERFLNHEPIRARRVGWFERWSKWVERRPAIASLTVAVATVAVLGFAGVFWQWNRSEQRRQELEGALVEIKTVRLQEVAQRERLNDTLYLQRIAAAYGEWLANHPGRAEQLLEQCDVQRREWEWKYLDRLMHAEHRKMVGHTLPVAGLAYSPDGKRIASSSSLWGYNTPGEIIVWSADTGSVEYILRGHDGPVTQVVFSPDGRQLASASGVWFGKGDGTVTIWDVETGKPIRTLKSGSGILLDVAYSNDGRWLAAGGASGIVHVWETATGDEIRKIRAHSTVIFRVEFSPDSRMMASASRDSTVRLWDPATGEPILSLRPGADVRSVAFSPDGRRLAASTWNGIVKVWEISEQQIAREVAHHQLRSDRVRALRFSPDGQSLAVACSDGSLRVWHPITGAELGHYRAHSGNAANVAFHPEGHMIATAGSDQIVKMWNLVQGSGRVEVTPHTAQISAIAFSPDGKLLAAAGGENHVHIGYGRKSLVIWDVEGQAVAKELEGHTDWLTSAAFSSDGQTVASGASDHLAILWNAKTGKRLFTLKGHTAAVTGVSFSPGGDLLATSSWDKTIRLWRVASGEQAAILPAATQEIEAIHFGLHGLLASGGRDGIVRIWDVTKQRTVAELKGHRGAIKDVRFSPDGSLLASCDVDAQLLVWQRNHRDEVESWTVKHHVQSSDRLNTIRIAFHPDGKRLVGTTEDSSVVLWDLATGQEAFAQRTGPEAMVAGAIEFAPDGDRLAIAYAQRLIIRDASARDNDTTQPVRMIDWHWRNAGICEADRNWAGARFHYDRLVAAEPTNWLYHFRRGDAHASQGNWQSADECYRRGRDALSQQSANPPEQTVAVSRQYRRSAQIQSAAGRVSEARQFLDQATELVESSPKAAGLDHVRERAEIALQQGRTYHRYDKEQAEKGYEEAVKFWSRVVEMAPDGMDARLNCSNALLNLAVTQAEEQHYLRARKVLEPLTKSRPIHRRVRAELALCLDDYGHWLENHDRHPEATEFLRKALQLRKELVAETPHDMEALRLLARSYDRVSPPVFDFVQTDELKAFWRMYVKTMEMDLASRATETISADAANMCAWNMLVCPFPELTSIEKAIGWGQIAVKQRPNDGGMLNTLAAAYYRNGEWNKAHELLQQAVRVRNGGDVYDWLLLAMTCSRLGDYTAAKEWLGKANEYIAERGPKSAPLLRLKAEAETLIAGS